MVRLSGPIGRVLAERTATSITALVAAGERNVVVDVSAVDRCTGHLLTALSGAHRTLTGLRGSLLLVGVRLPPFQAALETASLDEVFLVYDALRRDDRPDRRAMIRSRVAATGA
jgi:anti-anti-sigma regulatory factor